MFDIRLLETMVALAETKSFVRAADMLHLTQPGVSQQTARLERHFGVRLFTRGSGPVELTEAGRQIITRARDIIAAVARLEAEARAWAQGHAGALALGLSSAVLRGQLPHCIREFRDQHPQYSIKVEVKSADLLFAALEGGALDAIITTLPPTEPEYLNITLSRERLGVAIPSDHSCAARTSLRIIDLLDERFIIVPRAEHPELYDQVIATFTNAGKTLTVATEEIPFPSVLARVAMGEGVGLVPIDTAPDRSSGVIVVPLEDDLRLPIRFVARRGVTNAVADALIAHLQAGHFGSLGNPTRRETLDEIGSSRDAERTSDHAADSEAP